MEGGLEGSGLVIDFSCCCILYFSNCFFFSQIAKKSLFLITVLPSPRVFCSCSKRKGEEREIYGGLGFVLSGFFFFLFFLMMIYISRISSLRPCRLISSSISTNSCLRCFCFTISRGSGKSGLINVVSSLSNLDKTFTT